MPKGSIKTYDYVISYWEPQLRNLVNTIQEYASKTTDHFLTLLLHYWFSNLEKKTVHRSFFDHYLRWFVLKEIFPQKKSLPFRKTLNLHGNVLPSQGAIPQLLLALRSLTSVFDMGTGISFSLSSPHSVLTCVIT